MSIAAKRHMLLGREYFDRGFYQEAIRELLEESGILLACDEAGRAVDAAHDQLLLSAEQTGQPAKAARAETLPGANRLARWSPISKPKVSASCGRTTAAGTSSSMSRVWWKAWRPTFVPARA